MTRIPLYSLFFGLSVLSLCSRSARADFPLERTEVAVNIAGPMAELTVTQTFRNTYTEPIEATYTFPLQEKAAVDAAVMRIGAREIRAEIHERAEAKQIYEEARENGQAAALTEQERPNLFSQKVANIPPGQDIQVLVHVVQPLTYEDGTYRFEMPLVVGPRFIPAGMDPTDAAAISPPVLPTTDTDDQGIHNRVDLDIHVDMGLNLGSFLSTTHPQASLHLQPGGGDLSLHGIRADRDFVLEMTPATNDPQVSFLAQDGHFSLLVEPPSAPPPKKVVPRELVFVVDTSCSMSGTPLDMTREAMRTALQDLLPGDSFQIIRFDDTASQLSPRPLPATEENIKRGLNYVKTLDGGGGTNMLQGLLAALDYPETTDPERGRRQRIVALMTDGYIGNDQEILAAVADHLGRSRLFAFGIGSSVNRYLLDKAAALGRGTVSYVLLDDVPKDAVQAFYSRIARPVLTDIHLDWGGMKVSGLYPETVPDLYAGQPLRLYGEYKGQPGTLTVTGRLGDKAYSQKVDLRTVQSSEGGDLLASAWARAKVDALDEQQLWGESPEIREDILQTALEYRILTQYTSFVAVDQVISNPDGAPLRIDQPVEIPAGVSYDGVFGAELSRQTMRPGDPLLTVQAPEDARSVTAVFPWGEVATLQWDERRARWYHRFLVPRGVAEGDYTVSVFIVGADGRLSRAQQRLNVDATAPELDAAATWSPDGVLVRVHLEEPLRSLQIYPVGRPDLQKRIDLRSERYKDEDTIEVLLPGEWDEVVVSAKDPALNLVSQVVEVTDDAALDSGEGR